MQDHAVGKREVCYWTSMDRHTWQIRILAVTSWRQDVMMGLFRLFLFLDKQYIK